MQAPLLPPPLLASQRRIPSSARGAPLIRVCKWPEPAPVAATPATVELVMLPPDHARARAPSNWLPFGLGLLLGSFLGALVSTLIFLR